MRDRHINPRTKTRRHEIRNLIAPNRLKIHKGINWLIDAPDEYRGLAPLITPAARGTSPRSDAALSKSPIVPGTTLASCAELRGDIAAEKPKMIVSAMYHFRLLNESTAIGAERFFEGLTPDQRTIFEDRVRRCSAMLCSTTPMD